MSTFLRPLIDSINDLYNNDKYLKYTGMIVKSWFSIFYEAAAIIHVHDIPIL